MSINSCKLAKVTLFRSGTTANFSKISKMSESKESIPNQTLTAATVSVSDVDEQRRQELSRAIVQSAVNGNRANPSKFETECSDLAKMSYKCLEVRN